MKDYDHKYKGYGNCDSHCRIRVLEADKESIERGMTIVIASQANDDSAGTSVTNMAEQLATEISAKEKISPNRLIWIEHYPAVGDGRGASKESFDRVTFDVELKAGVFGWVLAHPKWTHLQREIVDALTGGAL